jgi:hypothetical protein
MEKER